MIETLGGLALAAVAALCVGYVWMWAMCVTALWAASKGVYFPRFTGAHPLNDPGFQARMNRRGLIGAGIVIAIGSPIVLAFN